MQVAFVFESSVQYWGSEIQFPLLLSATAWEWFERIFSWAELIEIGPDAAAYFIMAMAGTLLFAIKFFLMMFAGIDDIGADDLDFDPDAGSFSLFSTLSIVSFTMGAGWMGLIARAGWGLDSITSGLASAGFGGALMFMTAGLLYGMKMMNASGVSDVKTAVGRIGRVYMPIPESGQGRGKVEVVVSGQNKIVEAVSNGPAFESFASVKIVDTQDDGSVIVEPST